MVLIFVLVGMLIGIILVRFFLRPKNQILYCRERDGRGLEMDVAEEDALSLETKTDPELRFFKYGRSYEFHKRGRAFTRFFGKEGTAYTWLLEGFHKVATKFKKIPDIVLVPDGKGGVIEKAVNTEVPVEWENKTITVPFPTLEDAVKYRWGEEFYATVPEEQQALLRDNSMLVTVGLEPGIVPEGYEPITESTILNKADEDAAELASKAMQGAIKKSVLDWLPWVLAGAGAMAIISKLLGWW